MTIAPLRPLSELQRTVIERSLGLTGEPEVQGDVASDLGKSSPQVSIELSKGLERLDLSILADANLTGLMLGQTTLIGGPHYLRLREGPMGAWLPPVLDDQHLAGGILWASGDLIGVLFFAVLFTQWVRQSMREAAREDRRLDLAERRSGQA